MRQEDEHYQALHLRPTASDSVVHRQQIAAPTDLLTATAMPIRITEAESNQLQASPAFHRNVSHLADNFASPTAVYSLSGSGPVQEVDEFVDIFQVQQLLLDTSSHVSTSCVNQLLPPLPMATASGQMPSRNSSPPDAITSSRGASSVQHLASTCSASSASSSVINLLKPQPRPRLNLAKLNEYPSTMIPGKFILENDNPTASEISEHQSFPDSRMGFQPFTHFHKGPAFSIL